MSNLNCNMQTSLYCQPIRNNNDKSAKSGNINCQPLRNVRFGKKQNEKKTFGDKFVKAVKITNEIRHKNANPKEIAQSIVNNINYNG